MKKEVENIKKEENKYLFYTQYYFIAGVYHVVNAVNTLLNYSASYSSGVKEYLHVKVLVKQTIMNDITEKANKKKYEFDENDYVIIKMRKAPISSASVVFPDPVPNKTFEEESSSSSSSCGDENINAIVDKIVNDIINNATADATADATMDATADATVDATVDATADATVDAIVDATADATVDAIVDATADATVETIVNDIINNAVDLYFTKEGLKGKLVPFGVKGELVPFERRN